MMRNRVLDELYDIRTRILAEHGANLGDYMRCEFERLKSGGHPIARIKQRNICYAGAAKSRESATDVRSPALGDR